MSARVATHANPLDGVERVLIDGSNLLHAIRRTGAATPAAALIGRLRGVIEMPARIELLFDGPPDLGLRDARIASGVSVRYSGRLTADAVLARLVSEAQQPVTVLVITDDVELRREVMRRGASTASSRWLIGRLERSRLQAPSSPARARQDQPSPRSSSGGTAWPAMADPAARARAQALRAEGGDPAKDDAPDAPGWQPGRGATAKKGNPRRASKATRDATDRPRR